ncbi:hypothetical protein [Caballeronia mineralivorans]|uniref:hypothetical protein n=1 Tax=Caballeronia mineralivorans TaxID=2010198 RepID=UPI001364B09D|nr:hypothetical protein [Caballeronia mineralivorans]
MREIHGLVKGDVSDADVAHCFKASFGLENECTNERLKTAGLVLSEYDHPISSINSYVTDNSTALAVEIYALKVGKVNAFRADGRLDQDGFIQFTADHLGMKVDDARNIVWARSWTRSGTPIWTRLCWKKAYVPLTKHRDQMRMKKTH